MRHSRTSFVVAWVRTRPRPGLGRLTATGIVVAAVMSGAAFGATTPKFLNTKRVEQAIEHAALSERKMKIVVTCPSRVEQRKGLTFTCTTVVEGATTRFVVTQINSAGDVHYRAAG